MEIDGAITWDDASCSSVLFRCPATLDARALDGIAIDTTPGACTRYAPGSSRRPP
jgi:hypothetical protein